MDSTKQEGRKGTARFVEGEVPVSSTTGHRPSMFTKVEVRVPMDRLLDGKAACDPLRSEAFCRFASILGPEAFALVLNHFRPQIEDILNSWVLAAGFADGIKSMGYEVDAQDLAESLQEVFLEVVSRSESDADYERYVKATQPLGFEGVEVLEDVTGYLMERARQAVIEGVERGAEPGPLVPGRIKGGGR